MAMKKQYDYERAAALDAKARRLMCRHRSQLSFNDEIAYERHRRAMARIARLMGPYWEAERNYRIGQRLLALYD